MDGGLGGRRWRANAHMLSLAIVSQVSILPILMINEVRVDDWNGFHHMIKVWSYDDMERMMGKFVGFYNRCVWCVLLMSFFDGNVYKDDDDDDDDDDYDDDDHVILILSLDSR